MDIQVSGDSGSVAVSDAIFGVDFNEALIHQVVTAYLAGARSGTRGHKNRSAVSGGGAKPWRQKGTGRARAGTIRSPLWRGGGKTFAATNQDWSQKVNKKQYRAAMRSILAELARQERLVVVKEIAINEPKTKQAVAWLAGLGADNALIVTTEVGANVALATRNVPGIAVTDVVGLDPVSLVGFEKVVVTVEALQAIEGWLS